MRSKPESHTTQPKAGRVSRWNLSVSLLARWVLLIAALVLLNIGVGALVGSFGDPLTGTSDLMFSLMIVLLLVAYSLLLAVPFVPGVEIGVSLLVAHGSAMAPFVFLATVSGLTLAFVFGSLLADKVSCKFLDTMGFTKACRFVDEMKTLDRKSRLQSMQDALPNWAGKWILGHRFLLLALLLNIPGNSVIGGGGGIAVIAGLTRTFSFWQYLATILLATAPVPLFVYFFGTGLF